MQNWSKTGILGGTTTITPSSGPTDSAVFNYNVTLGNSGTGVSLRTATFSTIANQTGNVSFDWQYAYFHAFCCFPFADLILFDPTSFVDHATYEESSLRATGLKMVMVSGKIGYANQIPTTAYSGRIVRRGE